MKKLFFTAIAMLAFSAVSMANTIEIKEVEAPRDFADATEGTCLDAWMGNYLALRAAGNSDIDSIRGANATLKSCEREGKREEEGIQ